MVESKLDSMCHWERKKAIYLLDVADDLGMDTGGYGELAVNPNSGYTYLWLEDYGFTLYMPIDCELQKEDVYAIWINTYNGEEVELSLTESTTLEDLEDWVQELEEGVTDDD